LSHSHYQVNSLTGEMKGIRTCKTTGFFTALA